MEVINGEQNPLQNIVVLDHLVSFILLEELPTFRRVCKLWYLSSLKKWRKSKTLYLKSFGEGTFPNAIESEALKQFYQLDKYPYFNLQLDKNIMSSSILMICDATFWNHFGPTLTHLKLNEIPFRFDVNYFWEVILFKLPNLTDLIFQRNFWEKSDVVTFEPSSWMRKPIKNKLERFTITGDDYSHGMQMYIPWSGFFLHFPGLKCLEITDVSLESIDIFEEVLDGLKSWERHLENIPLERLTLNLARISSDEYSRLRAAEEYQDPDGILDIMKPFCNLKLPNLSSLFLDLGFPLHQDASVRLNERYPFIELRN